MHAISLLVGNELVDAEDIDRSAKPQGTFTPSISVIGSTGVSDFRVCDIDLSLIHISEPTRQEESRMPSSA